jgi:hypothetical protein
MVHKVCILVWLFDDGLCTSFLACPYGVLCLSDKFVIITIKNFTVIKYTLLVLQHFEFSGYRTPESFLHKTL